MTPMLPRRLRGSTIDLSFWLDETTNNEALIKIVSALISMGAHPNGEIVVTTSSAPFQSRHDVPLQTLPFRDPYDLRTAIEGGARVVECLLRDVFPTVTTTATDVYLGSDFGPPMVNGHPITISLPEDDIKNDSAWRATVDTMFSIAEETRAAYAAIAVEHSMPAPQSLDDAAAASLRTFYVGNDWAGAQSIEKIASHPLIEATHQRSGLAVRSTKPDHFGAAAELARVARRWLHTSR